MGLAERTTFGNASPPRPAGTGRACLILTSSSNPATIGAVFALGEESVVGRGADAHILLEDQGVSRRHVRIVRGPEGSYRVEDLRSTNGTFLNGLRVQEAELHEGDRLQIGTATVLRFSLQEQVGQQEGQLRQALAAARVGIWEWDVDSGTVCWSVEVDRMLELAHGALSGQAGDLLAQLHPADRERVHAALSRALAERTPLEVDFRLAVSPDRFRWLDCKGDVLCDAAGRPVRITGTVMDITGRRQAEEELRRHTLLLESLSDAVVLLGPEGDLLDGNGSAERLFGRSRQELRGWALPQLLEHERPEALLREVLEALEREGRWTGELAVARRGGPALQCEAVAVPLKDSGGSVLAPVLVLRDVTERRQLQLRLMMADRLTAVGQLGLGVAHEVNNPLTALGTNLAYVAGALGRLAEGPDPALVGQLEQVVREAQEGVERITTIVRDLSRLARDDDAPGCPVDVREAVELACRMAMHVLRHRARLVTELAPVPLVEASESRLCQVFLNLLLNAAQAIPEGGGPEHEVRVRLSAGAAHVVVEVQDTGVGMTPEVLARAFDPFFTTRRAGEARGLGLSISHGLVQSMGGRILVESTPGRGSTFRVELPTARARASTPPPAPAPPPRRRLLLVDGEPGLAASVQRALAPEHEVVAVHGAEAALRALEAGRFDLVLCDLPGPEARGEALDAALAGHLPPATGRLVFLTGGACTAPASRPSLSRPLDLQRLRTLLETSSHVPR